MRSFPISVRLALSYGLSMLLLLSGFAVFSYVGFHIAIHRDFDRHLTHEQRELLPFVAVDAEGPHFEGLEQLTSVAYQTTGIYGTYVRLLTLDGAVRYASPNFAGHLSFPVDVPENDEDISIAHEWDGLPARSRYVPLHTREGHLAGWLEVTGFEWSLHQELRQLGRTLTVGVLASVLFALLGGWWLARRTLKPVAAMTEAAQRMGGAGTSADLSARLPADFGPPDELTDLAETFNGLLTRLEASVARERRFTANAAHELLTPLATIRSEAEVALRRERDAPAYRETIYSLLLDIDRMTGTVRGLLQLARAETIVKRPEDRLDLSALVAERSARARTRAAAKGIAICTEVEPDVVVKAEPAPLTEVVDNLLSNAVKYTPEEGRIGIKLSHSNGTAVLSVTDSGTGFDADEADQLFDRFYRSDMAAVQAESGSGLGLAIVKAIVDSYGGKVSAGSAGRGRGAIFEVRLPCLTCRGPQRGT